MGEKKGGRGPAVRRKSLKTAGPLACGPEVRALPEDSPREQSNRRARIFGLRTSGPMDAVIDPSIRRRFNSAPSLYIYTRDQIADVPGADQRRNLIKRSFTLVNFTQTG
jgi:hypothetical protein